MNAQNSLNTMLATIAGGVGIIASKGNFKQTDTEDTKTKELSEFAGLNESIAKLEHSTIPKLESDVSSAEKDLSKYQEGQMKLYDNQNNPTWVSGKADEEEYNKQAQIAEHALKEAQGVLKGKQLQLELKKKRFEELNNKYGKEGNK